MGEPSGVAGAARVRVGGERIGGEKAGDEGLSLSEFSSSLSVRGVLRIKVMGIGGCFTTGDSTFGTRVPSLITLTMFSFLSAP